MADFPGAIAEPRVVENVDGTVYDPEETTRIFAEDVNGANEEIVAIEETLGINPQGSEDTVDERIGVAESDIVALDSAVDSMNTLPSQFDIAAALGAPVYATSLNFPLIGGGQGTALLSGRHYSAIFSLRSSVTLTGVRFFQSTQGAYTANNYNGFGIYKLITGTWTLVATSTHDAALWKGAANTWQYKAFSSPYAAGPGVYMISAIYSSSAQTTAPQIYRCPLTINSSLMFPYDGFSNIKFSFYDDSVTSQPSTIDPTGGTSNIQPYFFLLV